MIKTVVGVFVFIILFTLVCSAMYDILYPEDSANNKKESNVSDIEEKNIEEGKA